REGAPPTVVLGFEFWRSHYNGDNAVLGRTVLLGGTPYTVVGVAPRGFTGVDNDPVDLWVPAYAAAPQLVFRNALDSRGSFWCRAIARLRPGMTNDLAAAAATLPIRRGAELGRLSGSPPTVVLAPVLAGRGPEATSDVKVATWV